MSSYIKKGRVYMRCPNAKGKCPNNATEIEVLEQLSPVITSLSINKAEVEQICDELNKDYNDARELRERRTEALRSEYQKLMRRKDLTYEDKLDGRITPEKYDELVEKSEKRMLEIDEELVALEKGYEGSELTVSNLFKLACNAGDLLKSSKPAVKNQILRLLLSNCEIKQKRLHFNLLEPFSFLTFTDSRPTWLPGLDSNQ